jgi:hypothetical protein
VASKQPLISAAAAAAAAAAAVETSSKMKKFSISKHEKILSDTNSTFKLFQDLIKDIQDPYDNRTTKAKGLESNRKRCLQLL